MVAWHAHLQHLPGSPKIGAVQGICLPLENVCHHQCVVLHPIKLVLEQSVGVCQVLHPQRRVIRQEWVAPLLDNTTACMQGALRGVRLGMIGPIAEDHLDLGILDTGYAEPRCVQEA